jgi:hypothetical protein
MRLHLLRWLVPDQPKRLSGFRNEHNLEKLKSVLADRCTLERELGRGAWLPSTWRAT